MHTFRKPAGRHSSQKFHKTSRPNPLNNIGGMGPMLTRGGFRI